MGTLINNGYVLKKLNAFHAVRYENDGHENCLLPEGGAFMV